MSQGRNATRWRWAFVLVGLLLAWGLPELGLPTMLFPGTGLASRISRELIWWTFGAIMLLWVTFVEKQPLSSINLRRPGFGTLGWGFLFVVPMIASVMLSYALISRRSDCTRTWPRRGA